MVKHLIKDHIWLQKTVAFVLAMKLGLRFIRLIATRRILGVRALFDRRFNYGPMDVDHVRLPTIPVQLFKNVIFFRGLFHNNYLFSGMAKYSVERIAASLMDSPVRKPKDLPRVDINDITPEEFYERFVKTCHPVVLTGVDFDKERWNFDYFQKTYSDSSVLITDLKTGKSARRKLAALFNQSPQERLYVHNCESLWADDPDLLSSLRLEQFNAYLNREMKCAQIFMGFGADTGSDMHCANNFNVFFQLKGAKKWRFVNPEYTPLVYPYLSRTNGYFGSLVTYRSDADQVADVKKLFAHCPRYETIVREGEVLFNPPLWWHTVSATPETPETISVSTRWGSTSLSTIFGDRNKQVDCVETNHLFTSLQLPRALQLLYPAILHQIKQSLGKSALGTSLPADHSDTVFEEASHDDLPEEFIAGKIFKAFGISSGERPDFAGPVLDSPSLEKVQAQ